MSRNTPDQPTLPGLEETDAPPGHASSHPARRRPLPVRIASFYRDAILGRGDWESDTVEAGTPKTLIGRIVVLLLLHYFAALILLAVGLAFALAGLLLGLFG